MNRLVPRRKENVKVFSVTGFFRKPASSYQPVNFKMDYQSIFYGGILEFPYDAV
jgi:hypothetical protein